MLIHAVLPERKAVCASQQLVTWQGGGAFALGTQVVQRFTQPLQNGRRTGGLLGSLGGRGAQQVQVLQHDQAGHALHCLCHLPHHPESWNDTQMAWSSQSGTGKCAGTRPNKQKSLVVD